MMRCDVIRKMLAVTLCSALMTTGCAAAGVRASAGPQVPLADQRVVLADYVQRLPVGAKVRVERMNGGTLRGTLMKATAESIVVQKHTRVPEPPIDIPLSQVTRVTLDGGGTSTAKSVGIAIAVGAGCVLAFFAILLANYND
jgi:hypothetical protein